MLAGQQTLPLPAAPARRPSSGRVVDLSGSRRLRQVLAELRKMQAAMDQREYAPTRPTVDVVVTGDRL